MLLIDLSHTSHTPARTGIQRVARALRENLGDTATPVTRDPYLGAWRVLETWELARLANSQGGTKRGARWPIAARWRGRLRRWTGRTSAHTLHGEFEGLIEPELFVAPVARDLPKLFAQVRGPRIALFHDAIPLRFPELSPPSTVTRFSSYLRELLTFDGIAVMSVDSRDSLLGYWHWLGVSDPPPVFVLPLGIDPITSLPPTVLPASAPRPVVLSVGTLEGRKNHLALLEACERLWSAGTDFQLSIIGHVNTATGGTALARLRALQAAGRPLRYDGPVTDAAVAQAYATSTFTVYPSFAEGFGLPVIESLARGKPCVCSGHGALGEISRHGGCVPLEALDPATLADAIGRLLRSPAEVAALSDAARARTFHSWADYSRELITWMRNLPRR